MNMNNSPKPVRAFFDIDGVLAKFNHAARPEDLYRKGYFEELEAQENIVKASLLLQNLGIDVYSLSGYLSDNPYAVQEKQAWLDREAPFLGRKKRLFVPCGKDKTLAIPGFDPKADILIDDFGINCENWLNCGGSYVKVSRNNEDMAHERKKHRCVISPELSPAIIAATVLSILGGKRNVTL